MKNIVKILQFVSNKGSFQNKKLPKLGTLSQPLNPPSLRLNLVPLFHRIFQNNSPNLPNSQTSLPLSGQCPKFSRFSILEASLSGILKNVLLKILESCPNKIYYKLPKMLKRHE